MKKHIRYRYDESAGLVSGHTFCLSVCGADDSRNVADGFGSDRIGRYLSHPHQQPHFAIPHIEILRGEPR